MQECVHLFGRKILRQGLRVMGPLIHNPKSLKRTLPQRLYWSITCLYMLVIYYFSSLPHPMPESFRKYFSDWFLHGVEYGVLGFFLTGAIRFAFRVRSAFCLAAMAFAAGAVYGISDELHQRFVAGRLCDIRDWYADGVGVLAGTAVFFMVAGLFRNKKRSSVYAGS